MISFSGDSQSVLVARLLFSVKCLKWPRGKSFLIAYKATLIKFNDIIAQVFKDPSGDPIFPECRVIPDFIGCIFEDIDSIHFGWHSSRVTLLLFFLQIRDRYIFIQYRVVHFRTSLLGWENLLASSPSLVKINSPVVIRSSLPARIHLFTDFRCDDVQYGLSSFIVTGK